MNAIGRTPRRRQAKHTTDEETTVDAHEYHDITRRLVAMMANQDTINERLTASIERLDAHGERLGTAIEGINTTLARLETLLARMIRQSENGRDA
jgi:hypothetical protein